MAASRLARSPEPQTDPVVADGPSGRFAAGVFVALAGLVAVLSFADRAPELVRQTLRALARLSNPIEDVAGVSVTNGADLPYSWDVVGHFALWAAVAVVGWWAFRRRFAAPTLALVLFIASYAVEIGQNYLSATRTPDPRDLMANGFGIVVGLVAAVIVGWCVPLVGRAWRANPTLRG